VEEYDFQNAIPVQASTGP